jgi:hypothetical protein
MILDPVGMWDQLESAAWTAIEAPFPATAFAPRHGIDARTEGPLPQARCWRIAEGSWPGAIPVWGVVAGRLVVIGQYE